MATFLHMHDMRAWCDEANKTVHYHYTADLLEGSQFSCREIWAQDLAGGKNAGYTSYKC